MDARGCDALDRLLTERLLPVLQALRERTGDAAARQTHYVFPTEPPEVSVVFVLDSDRRLQDASDTGVTEAIAMRTLDVVREAAPGARFERHDIRFTTQEYCDDVHGGNWSHYFK